jgi:hypothetical protein
MDIADSHDDELFLYPPPPIVQKFLGLKHSCDCYFDETEESEEGKCVEVFSIEKKYTFMNKLIDNDSYEKMNMRKDFGKYFDHTILGFERKKFKGKFGIEFEKLFCKDGTFNIKKIKKNEITSDMVFGFEF